jgi:hypothetical protein
MSPSAPKTSGSSPVFLAVSASPRDADDCASVAFWHHKRGHAVAGLSNFKKHAARSLAGDLNLRV